MFEEYKRLESNRYIYKRAIPQPSTPDKDCQLIGNAFIGTVENSFVLCGMNINYLKNNLNSAAGNNNYYQIDESEIYLTIAPDNSDIRTEMYCHSCHSVTFANQPREPVFICSY